MTPRAIPFPHQGMILRTTPNSNASVVWKTVGVMLVGGEHEQTHYGVKRVENVIVVLKNTMFSGVVITA